MHNTKRGKRRFTDKSINRLDYTVRRNLKEDNLTYILSDLHGKIEKWEMMLKKINFSNDDKMYILGDVIDRGESPIGLLKKIIYLKNVECIMGNHEWTFLNIYSKHINNISSFNVCDMFATAITEDWKTGDGRSTYKGFIALTNYEMEEILDYIKRMKLFKNLKIKGKEYILTHSGLGNFAETKKLSEYKEEEILENRVSSDTKYYNDRTVILGHSPTFRFGEKYTGKIIKTDTYINVDCGAAYESIGGRLACIRLEDKKEFYV